MLIIGTGGMAREVAGIIEFDHPYNNLFFFNDLDQSVDLLWDRYIIYHSYEELKIHFQQYGNQFICCIANPLLRQRITEKIEKIGGVAANAISYRSDISHFCKIDKGVVIQPGCVVASDTIISKGVFMNAHAIVGHDSIIEPFVTLGPGSKVLGNVTVGEHSYIGTNSVIMPGVKIGKKVRIGVGKIITNDVVDNSKVL